VKASRLFAGYEHEQAIKKLAAQFNKPQDYYTTVTYDASLLTNVVVQSYESAYHHLISCIIQQQVSSTNLVLAGTNVRKIFVDGGFSKNAIYMQLLADNFPGIEIYAASIPQASALGAALAIHHHWNEKKIPTDIIELKYYSSTIHF
jgi:glycerol kinase